MTASTLIENRSQNNPACGECGQCGRSRWVHFLKPSRKGWLFCNDGGASSFPLREIAEVYGVVGRQVPQSLAGEIRREKNR